MEAEDWLRIARKSPFCPRCCYRCTNGDGHRRPLFRIRGPARLGGRRISSRCSVGANTDARQVRPSAPARFAELAAVAPLGRTLDPAIAGPIGRVGSVKPAVFPVDDETTYIVVFNSRPKPHFRPLLLALTGVKTQTTMSDTLPDNKWNDLLVQFKASLEADEKSANTVRNYHREVRAFGEWYHSIYEEAPDLAGPTADDFRRYKDNLKERKLQPQSINLAIVSMHSLVKWACDNRFLRKSIKSPRAVKQAMKVPRWLDRPQERRLMKAVRKAGHPHHLGLVEMFLVFGLRNQ